LETVKRDKKSRRRTTEVEAPALLVAEAEVPEGNQEVSPSKSEEKQDFWLRKTLKYLL